ncbi:MAG TPA: hypothetical protein PLS94_03855 [Prolixibacteraceae bacterium]|nr:hypothetical protein [Prolixibacteraceae bacterium]HPR59526.1 hypothetical protein [Prolixibacteraceae bacterium]
MEIHSNISNPIQILVFVIAAIFAITYAVYYFKKNNDEFNKNQRLSLSIIKFIYSLIIGILLLSPLAEIVRNRTEKPILVLGIDNSESMAADSANFEKISNFIASARTELGNKFQIEALLFDNTIRKSDSISFNGKISNYSGFINELEKRYFNLNLGAVVLLGDGIYNQGRNPEQIIDNINAPFFTLGLGDTSSYIDQAIIDVTHNPNVFMGNTFPVEVEVNFTDFNYPKTQISISIDGKLAVSESIEVQQANYYFRKTYNISTEQLGLRNVNIALSPVTNEHNKQNNRYNFTIEVHDNKKEILVLTQGPHPDIGAITQTLEQKANYKITITPIALFNGNIDKYDLVVLNQLPSLMHQNHNVFKSIKENSISTLVIVGPNTSISALNNLELGFKLTPTLLTENSEPFFNKTFQLFSIPEKIEQTNGIYPPLLTYYTQYEHNTDLSVIAYQKIKGIEMNYPLMLAGNIDERKVGAIFGEGIWRWRLREFQNFDNQDIFNQLTVNLFSYLTLRDEREQFKLAYQRIASESVPYRLKAQVFNDIFEPVANAEIQFTLTDSTGSELNFLFDVNQTEYNLNLGLLAPGKYSFKARANLGENEFEKTGTFSIQEVNIEQQNLKTNLKTLNILAQATGGKFFYFDKNQQLIDYLNNIETIEAKIHKEKSTFELIDWKWYILFIIVFLSLEWFLRKFWGSY